MKYSRSFTLSLLLTSYILLRTSNIYAIDIPHLTLEKNFFQGPENISVRYEGQPTMLTAQLIDRTDTKVEYKAVLQKRNDKEYMDFLTAEPLKPGKYALKIWKDNDKLVDSFVYWGVDEPVTPTPPKPVTDREFINRDAPTKIEAGKTYAVSLSFIASKDYKGLLSDRVPYDAIVEASDAAEIKNPKLLSLRMPFENDYEMTAPFGQVNPAEHLGMSMHDGVDFATPVGTPIFAVDDGEIVPYREANHYGITQAVQHSWGSTFYGHLSTVSAEIGQKVRKGQKIGITGNTGLSTGPHLHFGMKWGDEFINGLPYISQKNISPSSQKELSWDIDVKKGDKVTRSYMFVMPPESTRSADLTLGPAHSTDILEQFKIDEEKAWNLAVAATSSAH